MSAEHQLQRAIYAKAKGNMSVRFLYVSEKKTSMLEDGDPTELLAQAKVQISRMVKHSCGTATKKQPGRSCRCSRPVSTGKARKICAKNFTASKP
jgi:hypothetical protein